MVFRALAITSACHQARIRPGRSISASKVMRDRLPVGLTLTIVWARGSFQKQRQGLEAGPFVDLMAALNNGRA
jgi:hypothetical protein